MWTQQSSIKFTKAISVIPHKRIHQKHIDEALAKQYPNLLKKFNNFSSGKKDELKPYILAAKDNIVCKVCEAQFCHWSRDNNSWTPACRACMKTPEGQKAITNKIKSTFTRYYGVDNPSKVKSIQRNKKRTCLKRYGTENPAQNKEVREKMGETMIENHGATHAFKVPELKDKMEQTMLKRHGGLNSNNSPAILKKIQATNLLRYGTIHSINSKHSKAKSKKTLLRKYGVECSFQATEVKKKVKDTLLARYGVDNPLKSKTIQQKVFTSQRRIWKVVTKRDTYYVQGYERYIIYTLEKKFDLIYDQYHPLCPTVYLEDNTNYFPDFYIPKKDLLIEIKCLYTLYTSSIKTWELNKYKAEQCYEQGLNIKWAVVEMKDKNPYYFVLPKTWFKMSWQELDDYCGEKNFIKGCIPKPEKIVCRVAIKGEVYQRNCNLLHPKRL